MKKLIIKDYTGEVFNPLVHYHENTIEFSDHKNGYHLVKIPQWLSHLLSDTHKQGMDLGRKYTQDELKKSLGIK